MTNFTELASVPSDRPAPFTDQLRLAVAAYLARFKGSAASTPIPTCAATFPGAPGAAWTHWPPEIPRGRSPARSRSRGRQQLADQPRSDALTLPARRDAQRAQDEHIDQPGLRVEPATTGQHVPDNRPMLQGHQR